MKSYKEYCMEWAVGCLTAYSRRKWGISLKAVGEGIKALGWLLFFIITPLLSILFPIGALLLKHADKKVEEAERRAIEQWKRRTLHMTQTFSEEDE